MLSEHPSPHQRVPDAVGLAAELQEPPVVHDAVLCEALHYAKPAGRHAGQGPHAPAPALHNVGGSHILGGKESGNPRMEGDRHV